MARRAGLASAFLCAFALAAPPGWAVTFEGATYATDTTPLMVRGADLDGDGDNDLVTANQNGSTVSVFAQTGAGQFTLSQTPAAGDEPYAVAIGDLNGDGDPDLVTANRLGSGASVLLGSAGVTFGVTQFTDIGSQPTGLDLGDLDEDGDLDVAVADIGAVGTDHVWVAPGNGDGTFGTPAGFTSQNGAVDVAIGDLNGDGNLDLAVANQLSDSVSVLIGDGQGSFLPPSSSSLGDQPRDVQIADVDQDGDADLVVAAFGASEVSVLLGNGSGGFGAPVDLAVGVNPHGVATGDIDSDGKLDVVVAAAGPENTVWFAGGNGDGTFRAAEEITINAPSHSVFVGNLNGDSRPDIATANANSDSSTVLLNTTLPRTGGLAQKSGAAGCVNADGSEGCAEDTAALANVRGVVVSPDGRHIYATSPNSDAVLAFDRDPATGAATQKQGLDACVAETAAAGCADGNALDLPDAIAMSPDGRSVYVASTNSDGVAIFDRDPGSGALTQKPGTAGCVTQDGSGGTCQDGRALADAVGVAVSGDGRNVYVASQASSAVAILDRDPATGDVTQKPGTAGCVSETGAETCQDGNALTDATGIAAAPDGRSVYLTGQSSNAIVTLDRDLGNGELTQSGCVNESGSGGCSDGVALEFANAVAVSPDGDSVYVASGGSSAVAAFDRSPVGALTQKPGTAACISASTSGGACRQGTGLDLPVGIAVSPDGRSVYAAMRGASAVAVLDRDPETGDVVQRIGTEGCVSDTGSGGACVTGRELGGAYGVAVSPDGGNVYVGAWTDNALAVFDRARPPVGVTQKSSTAGCVSASGNGDCQDGVAMSNPFASAVSPDGRNVYVADALADAVLVFDRDPRTGEVTQKAGPAGCISDEPGFALTCAAGRAMRGPVSVVVSPDGRHVYAGVEGSDAVVVFTRDPVTGALAQPAGPSGCVSEDGTDGAIGTCANGTGLNGANGIAITPDGASVYVASATSDAVAALDRGFDGRLTPKPGPGGCISDAGGDCTDGVALNGARAVVASADGRSVYVAALDSSAVAVFDRDGAGVLTQQAGLDACVSETGTGGLCEDGIALTIPWSLAISPDDENVYVADENAGGLAILNRDTGTGGLDQPAGTDACITQTGSGGCEVGGQALQYAQGVAVAPDGRSVLVAAGNFISAVTTLDREATGALDRPSGSNVCVSESGSGGACEDGRALGTTTAVSISPDGRNVYATSRLNGGEALVVLDRALERAPVCGATTKQVRHNTATAVALDCTDPDAGDQITFEVVDGPDHGSLGAIDQGQGTVTYTPTSGFAGVDTFTVRASDGVNDSNVGTVLLQVNALPVCSNGSHDVPHGTATQIPLACTDPDTGTTLTRQIVSGPQNGTLGSVNQGGGTVTYTPSPGYAGGDSFTFRASDGLDDSAVATASLAVAAAQQEQPPEAPPSALSLSIEPPASQRDAGQDVQVRALARSDGRPLGGARIAWRVDGPNPRPQAVATTGADGAAALSWLGQSNGTDTVTAFLDSNGDGARQQAEPEASGTVSWRNGLPPSIRTASSIDELPEPERFREGNVEPVGGGEVYVKLPGSASRARASQAPGVEKGFIPLREAAQLPVGTIIDADQGRAKIEAALDARSRRTNTADFYEGTFRFTQPRAGRGLTEMALTGGSFRSCSRAKRGGRNVETAQRSRRVRRLWGSGRGKFRTRGRYAAATIRGTVWLVEDRCDGTLTRVRSGTVSVRDLTRRRTVSVRAGRSYFASAFRNKR